MESYKQIAAPWLSKEYLRLFHGASALVAYAHLNTLDEINYRLDEPVTFETAVAAAFSPSATVTIFLRLAGEVLADREPWPVSGSSSINWPEKMTIDVKVNLNIEWRQQEQNVSI